MNKPNEGLTKKQAKVVERTIVGFSILSLVFLFQPFSMTLYSHWMRSCSCRRVSF